MAIDDQLKTDYATVAASQAAAVLAGQSGVGGIGDVLARVIIIPATVSPDAVTLKDGNKAAITLLPGGANSLTELKPIVVELNARSADGAWKITTGANVSVIATGRFQ